MYNREVTNTAMLERIEEKMDKILKLLSKPSVKKTRNSKL